MQALVTTDWLERELGASDLCVIDATWTSPEMGRDPAVEYAAAHIPGAVFMNLGELRDTSSPLPNMLPMPEKFASRMQALGVGDASRIVVYDSSPYRTAARAWWMLRLFGAHSVAVLDGGWAKWQAEGRPVEAGIEAPRPRPFTVWADFRGVRTLDQIRADMAGGGEQLVDARSAARFAGEEPETRPGLAAGHIPGSRNLPYGQLFEADGTWKQGAALEAAFAAAGVDPDRPVVTTCGSGITAAVLLLGLHLLGREAALYDGSWTEWGGDPSTPKAKGRA